MDQLVHDVFTEALEIYSNKRHSIPTKKQDKSAALIALPGLSLGRTPSSSKLKTDRISVGNYIEEILASAGMSNVASGDSLKPLDPLHFINFERQRKESEQQQMINKAVFDAINQVIAELVTASKPYKPKKKQNQQSVAELIKQKVSQWLAPGS